MTVHDRHTAAYPALWPRIDYYAVEYISELFRHRPGYEPGPALDVFFAIVEQTDFRPYLDRARARPNPEHLHCRGCGIRELEDRTGLPYATVGRYAQALEDLGLIAPLGTGARGWRLDLVAVRQGGAFVALMEG